MRLLILVIALAAWSSIEAAAQSTVQPAQGQSAEQMQKDVAECQNLATQSSGHIPGTPPPSSASDERYVGGRAKGATAGAAAGRTAAQVRGNQHEEAYDKLSDEAKREYRKEEGKPAAAAGMVVGGSRQRRDRRAGRKSQEDAEAQAKAAADAYDQANRSCLTGRGYTVAP
jgi:hypothetical protein